jgi:hypothetical protein
VGQAAGGRGFLPDVEQEQTHTPVRVDEAPPLAGSPGIAHVRALLGELEQNPGNEDAASSFNRAVGALAKQRSPEVFDFLRQLAELPVLAEAKDANGFPCRAAVLAAWVDLGYPWALELPPEDHAWLRARTPGNGAGWLSVTFVLAFISALLNVGAVLLFLVDMLSASSPRWLDAVFAVPFAAMGAHAIATLVASQVALHDGVKAAGRLRALGYAGLVAPAVGLALGGLVAAELGLCVFVLCLPFVAAAFTAWGASRALPRARQ